MSFLVRLRSRLAERAGNWRTFWLSARVAGKSRPRAGQPPVVFFNASTRLTGVSLNAAFAYLTACGLQLAGTPVVYFACKRGMGRCVLGTDFADHTKPPPCKGCVAQAEGLFSHAPTVWFSYARDEALAEVLNHLDVEALSVFEYTCEAAQGDLGIIPLGKLVLPSIRWALRLHHLQDDEATRFLFCEYILSALNIACEFNDLVEKIEPGVVVLFNGVMYPEATARWVAKRQGLRVITHEVGFGTFSGFFSDGEATAYPIDIPAGFELSLEQNARLDVYLGQRFQGQFTMAGIRFWPEIHGLDKDFNQRAARFRQIVPVFTNVVYDTSQVHANAVFPHMFAWLDLILETMRAHPETLFVIRAHPDEMRPGSRKQSRESVQEWVERNQVEQLPNVIFVEPLEYLSSYELIQRSKFVMVYNSSIGLEAALMGKTVLCGGKARYTQYPIVFFPGTPEDYRQKAEQFLDTQGSIEPPSEFVRNARNFLYYQFFRASLPFGEFLENSPRPGFVRIKPFSWKQLTTERSATMRVLAEGILEGKPFLLPEVKNARDH